MWLGLSEEEGHSVVGCTGSGARLVNEKKGDIDESSGGLDLRNDASNSFAQGSRFFELNPKVVELLLQRRRH